MKTPKKKPDSSKKAKASKEANQAETSSQHEEEETPSNGGLPDVDFKKFLGCGG